MDEQGNIIIYQSEDGAIRLDVRLESNTVWLTQQQMADLFGSSRTNVVEHIKHIYEDEELNEETTCRRFRQVRQEGNREVSREIPFYNLDMIISVGCIGRCLTSMRQPLTMTHAQIPLGCSSRSYRTNSTMLPTDIRLQKSFTKGQMQTSLLWG